LIEKCVNVSVWLTNEFYRICVLGRYYSSVGFVSLADIIVVLAMQTSLILRNA